MYLAKTGRVWQRIATREIYGDKIELKNGEHLTEYKSESHGH